MSKKQKQVRAKNGATVDVELEVLPSGRHVRFEVDDPGEPGKKMSHTVTLGAEDAPLPANVLGMDDAQLDLALQGIVDAEAAKFADLVEGRRRVAARLGNIS